MGVCVLCFFVFCVLCFVFCVLCFVSDESDDSQTGSGGCSVDFSSAPALKTPLLTLVGMFLRDCSMSKL